MLIKSDITLFRSHSLLVFVSHGYRCHVRRLVNSFSCAVSCLLIGQQLCTCTLAKSSFCKLLSYF